MIIEDDPHQLLEGIIISSYAIKCHLAYIYIRGEMALGYERLWEAVREAKAKGFLGKNILGTGFDLDVVIHRGAGAYICGEETGLLESLEGKRGYPRIKPPFPATHGLFGCPDHREQRRDARLRAAHRAARRRLVPRHRTGEEPWPEALLRVRSRRPTGRLRAADGHAAARDHLRACRRHPERPPAEGASFPGGASMPPFTAGEIDVPMDMDSVQKAGLVPRLGGHHGDGRLHLHGVGAAQPDQLLPPRVVRPVHAVPRGHRLARPRAARARERRPRRRPTSTCSSTSPTTSRATPSARWPTAPPCRRGRSPPSSAPSSSSTPPSAAARCDPSAAPLRSSCPAHA